MGLIIIFCIIYVIWIVGAFWCNKHCRSNYGSSICIALFCVVATIVIVPITITVNRLQFDKEIADYHALKELVDSHRIQDLSEFERIGVIENIHETNKNINAHKVYSQSFLVNFWWSKEIGELPYIK